MKALKFIAATSCCALLMMGCKPVPSSTNQSNTTDDSTSSTETETIERVAESETPDLSFDSNTVTLGMTPGLTMGIPGSGELTLEQIKSWLEKPGVHDELEIKLPLGLAAAKDNIKGIKENPMTRAKIELGRQLYFDTRLSKNNTVSCATCHHPDEGFGKHTQFGVGIEKQEGNRNSPVSYNRIVSGPQFWDGRADSLEAQAIGPIENPIEMGNTHENCVATLKGIEGYVAQFDKIFPGEGVTIENVGKAIATFERTIVTGPTKYDYLEVVKSTESQWGDEIEELEEEDPERFSLYEMAKEMTEELDEGIVRGRDLFFSEKSNCTACHAGANFTDEKYHNLGVGMEAAEPDVGRFSETKKPEDTGAFKTPTVRNVATSAPYMHDGSQKTLEEVVEWYAKGGHANEHLSDKVKKLELTDQDKNDLVVFMKDGLTGTFPEIESGRLPQ
ncbi:MAG: cytochrome c peroxidase [Planctomycetota bacterium]